MNNELTKWERHFLEQKSSGLSQAEYCKRNSLSDKQFYYWRKKWEGRSSSTGKFAAVASSVNGADFKLELSNGSKLSIPSDFNEGNLKRLISALSC